MRQTILEMVRFARDPMLGLMLLAKKLTLQQDDEVRQADRQEYLLMREWLSACLEPSMFVSMPFLDDGHKKASFAQVLAVNPIVKTVHSKLPRRTRRPCRGVYHVV